MVRPDKTKSAQLGCHRRMGAAFAGPDSVAAMAVVREAGRDPLRRAGRLERRSVRPSCLLVAWRRVLLSLRAAPFTHRTSKRILALLEGEDRSLGPQVCLTTAAARVSIVNTISRRQEKKRRGRSLALSNRPAAIAASQRRRMLGVDYGGAE